MISQLAVFLSNEKGRLAAVCRTLADHDINMHSLFVADTEDFGVVRIFCDTPDRAVAVLKEAGYRASLTKVVGVKVPNERGGLARLLEFLDANDVNVEYSYCFLAGADAAIDVIKVDDADIEAKLIDGGFVPVMPEEIYQV